MVRTGTRGRRTLSANLRYLEYDGNRYVLILSGDQLYRMDYRTMLAEHKRSGADVTLATVPIHADHASAFGLVQFDDTGRVTGFVEKPQTREELDKARSDVAWIESKGVEARGRDCLANMGIYLFNLETLHDVLTTTRHEDFGKQIFPELIEKLQVRVFV